MYGLEKINYSSISECSETIKQIADGINEDKNKLKQIIDGLVVEDFNTDLTTQQLRDAVNGVLYGVDRCVENLNKYSVHLTKIATEWQETDDAIGKPIWEPLNNTTEQSIKFPELKPNVAEPTIKFPDIKDYTSGVK